MITKNTPFINIGPGEFIKEELKVRNWRQEDLAEILGISLKSVNKLIKNKQSITIETATILSKAFGQSPQYWINLDTNYRLRLQPKRKEEEDVEVKAKIYMHMPVTEMIKKRWITEVKNIKSLIEQVKKFWEIEEIDFSFLDKTTLPNFRKSDAFDQYNKYYALTWVKMAKQCAKGYKMGSYLPLRLDILAKNFHKYTTSENGVKLLLDDLNKAGIKFFVLSHLQKTYIDGASFFDGKNPVIVYTRRYDRIDNFWFTIAHEIAHINLHLKNTDDIFIDDLDDLKNEVEREANQFASKMLKTNEILKYFKPFKNYISKMRVEDCAGKLEMSPAIVVGVLQHHRLLSRRNLNRLKSSISEIIPNKYHIEKHIRKIREAA